jgi:gluconolactonase
MQRRRASARTAIATPAGEDSGEGSAAVSATRPYPELHLEMREVASGLQFPEGPVALADGSVLVVEMKSATLTRIVPGGAASVVARLDGGPNGAAIGPDGAVYICNNGGHEWHELMDLLVPGEQSEDYEGGRIDRVELDSGAHSVLYTTCDGHRLRGPNDLVFDTSGGFWFTDHGKIRARDRDRGGVYYARADGSMIREVIYPLDGPNGIGLSPDGTRLYVAETFGGRLWYWDVVAPGELARGPAPFGHHGGTLVVGLPGLRYLDSLAVEENGNVVVGTLIDGGLTVVSPDGASIEHVPLPDGMPCNLCFAGPDLRTAYVVLSTTGKLVALEWPRPGLRLAW